VKVLITGAGGFIGSHLVDSQLDKGNDVRAVDLDLNRLSHVAGQPNLETIQVDITGLEQAKKLVDGIDVVYHLASAHLDVRLSSDDYRRVNVGGSLGLLQAARQAGVRRFVHCSSVGVIGNVEIPPADETTACQPTNIYEKTKLEGEQAVLEFARQNAYPVVVARPAWVYGPRCPRTDKLLRTIAKGRFLIFGSGKNMRHPIYISDAVRALELCAEVENIAGEVYIIAGADPVQVAELVNVISQELGASSPKLHLPITFGLWGGMTLELVFKLIKRPPPFSRRSVDFFLKHNAYDISKARRELGFQPEVDLVNGIRKTIDWQRGQTDNQRNLNHHG
jgi:nucleoside-diphosphate-sugar epimerase